MGRAFSTALQQIRRSPYQAMGVVLVLFNTFFLGYIYSYIFFGSEFLLRFFETRPQVIAFFEADTTTDVIADIEQEMKGKSYVETVRIVTKEEALATYREENKNDPLLAELVTADVFPASIEVSGKEIASLSQIQQDLSAFDDSIEEIVFQKDIIDTLGRWTKTVRIVGIGMIAILSLTSLLIVSIIISMKVLVKKQEIAIMRLLGASAMYIEGPFMAEGMLYGVVGSILGWIAATTILLYITPWIVDFLGEIPLLPVPPLFLAAQVGVGTFIGILLGIVASVMALRRYIK